MAPAAAEAAQPLRVFFFPFMTPGHMIPMLDMAKLFSYRGVAVTIITTPGNEPRIRPIIDRTAASGNPIHLHLLPFPSSVKHLLPRGRENLSSITSSEFTDFMIAVFALQEPLDRLLHDQVPDCLVSDAVFTWTSDTALDLGIPRLVFNGPGIFPLFVQHSLELHKPYEHVTNDSDVFVVAGLPHRIEMTRSELSDVFLAPSFMDAQREAERKSFGVVVNSFYGLEPAYAELFREHGRKAWYVGPVSICNKDDTDRAERGDESRPGVATWLRWLDFRPARSVLYVCFGSLCEVPAHQLREIASGLEESGHLFVWVMKEAGETAAEWLPEGFEERLEGKGLIIRGWAPQILILNHPAVGGFLTHCGWNSTIEGVSAGVPMMTWPLSYEQFVNEKFITQVLEIGVRVRREKAVVDRRAVVKAAEVAGAVGKVMGGGEEADGMRRRAREYMEMARSAMEEGGSSYVDMGRLIDELMECRRVVEGGKKVRGG